MSRLFCCPAAMAHFRIMSPGIAAWHSAMCLLLSRRMAFAGPVVSPKEQPGTGHDQSFHS
eukprot:14368513-Alexandrium_andersonii.AAC.1